MSIVLLLLSAGGTKRRAIREKGRPKEGILGEFLNYFFFQKSVLRGEVPLSLFVGSRHLSSELWAFVTQHAMSMTASNQQLLKMDRVAYRMFQKITFAFQCVLPICTRYYT